MSEADIAQTVGKDRGFYLSQGTNIQFADAIVRLASNREQVAHGNNGQINTKLVLLVHGCGGHSRVVVSQSGD
jgi:hypothetical protein